MKTKTILFAILCVSVFLSAQAGAQEGLEKVFYFHLIIYRIDTATLTNFEIIDGVPTDFPNIPLELNYTLLVFSIQDEILFKAKLPVSFTAYPMPPEGQPDIEVQLNESEQYLRLPYFENAKKIEIYHDDKLIFSYDICQLDYVCENSKGENSINCPIDCPPPTTATTIPVKPPSTPIYLYLIVIVIIIAVAVFFLLKIKTVRTDNIY
jgi:hypothetical protein